MTRTLRSQAYETCFIPDVVSKTFRLDLLLMTYIKIQHSNVIVQPTNTLVCNSSDRRDSNPHCPYERNISSYRVCLFHHDRRWRWTFAIQRPNIADCHRTVPSFEPGLLHVMGALLLCLAAVGEEGIGPSYAGSEPAAFPLSYTPVFSILLSLSSFSISPTLSPACHSSRQYASRAISQALRLVSALLVSSI